MFIDEAMAMREIGVDVEIFGLVIYQDEFERNCPAVGLAVTYGETEDIVALAGKYNAVTVTYNTCASVVISRVPKRPPGVVGYYVQGSEPYRYPHSEYLL